MKKRLLIAAPSLLVLIALLFPLTSANQIDPPTKPKAIASVIKPRPLKTDAKTNAYREQLAIAIQAYFTKAIAQKKIVGAAVGIVKCDSMIYLGGFGKRNSKQDATINAETVFRIGSVSKGFAGILAGIQVEKGLLDWNDKVIDYVPSFQLASRQITTQVTLHHILSQTSGLPHHSFTNQIEEGLDLETIAGNFKNIKDITYPGTTYNYQNAIYALGGTMIEKVSGNTYSEEIQQKIFAPLQMNTASTDYESFVNQENIAYPHRKRYGRFRPKKINKKYYNAIAAGGVNASITDMAKYMRFLLGYNPEVLSTTVMEQVFNPVIKIDGHHKYYQKWAGHQTSHYGLGWRIHTFKDEYAGAQNTIIHHGGYVNNYRSEIAIYPSEDIGITVLFNSPTKLARTVIPDIHTIVKHIMELPEEEILLVSSDL